MGTLFFLVWLIGGPPAAVLSEVVLSERPKVARAGRLAFAAILALDLLLAAVAFTVGNSNPSSELRATRSIWWLTAIAGGIPLVLVSGLIVRRGYRGNRVVLAVATISAAGLYVAFPLAFVPADQPLRGLARFVHEHHALVVLALVTPSLMLLASEFRRRREAVSSAPSGT